jgi:hypothetical protein
MRRSDGRARVLQIGEGGSSTASRSTGGTESQPTGGGGSQQHR